MNRPLPSMQPVTNNERRCRRLGSNSFEISWQVNATSRRSMNVDTAGAERFCEKWQLEMPA